MGGGAERSDMVEEIAQMTEEIRRAEEGKVRIEYYTLDGRRPEIFMCPGDLIVICNVLHDYAGLLENIMENDEGYQKALYEYHAKRCRKIQHQIEEALGYSTELAIEKCKRHQERRRKDDDVGEDAFVLAVRRRGEEPPQPNKAKKAEEPPKSTESSIIGQMSIEDMLGEQDE